MPGPRGRTDLLSKRAEPPTRCFGSNARRQRMGLPWATKSDIKGPKSALCAQNQRPICPPAAAATSPDPSLPFPPISRPIPRSSISAFEFVRRYRAPNRAEEDGFGITAAHKLLQPDGAGAAGADCQPPDSSSSFLCSRLRHSAIASHHTAPRKPPIVAAAIQPGSDAFNNPAPCSYSTATDYVASKTAVRDGLGYRFTSAELSR